MFERALRGARRHTPRDSGTPDSDATPTSHGVAEREAEHLLATGEYDFVDLGCSTGAAIAFAQRRLGGTRGLGIDRSPEKIEIARSLGFEAAVADVTVLNLPPDSVRFVIISHVLESLADTHTVTRILDGAIRAARDFVYVVGPCFDADARLAELGLKTFWSDWPSKRFRLSPRDLIWWSRSNPRIVQHNVALRRQILESSDTSLHPLESPPGVGPYDVNAHSPKPTIDLRTPAYAEYVAVFAKRFLPNWGELVDARPGSLNIHDLQDIAY
jgi:SAM-dependent methyltransferase